MAVRIAFRPLFAASARAMAPPRSAATVFPAAAHCYAPALVVTRSFVQTRGLGLKESSSHDPNPDETHKHVQDSLSKQKKGQGHWKSELASDSEELVRADRDHREQQQASSGEAGSGTSSEAHIKELQERTKHHAEEKSKAGTSVREG